MDGIDDRINRLNLDLFSAIESETSTEDRHSMLLIHRAVRKQGRYSYIEIGSHLGGTLQPHLQDPRCVRIYSIDKRPEELPDIRGYALQYEGNSTERMLIGLRAAYPDNDIGKITTFDSDASGLRKEDIPDKADICLIDGEHTNEAAVSDFNSCLPFLSSRAVVAFHDSCLVFEGIKKIKRILEEGGQPFRGLMLPGCVYALLLGSSVVDIGQDLESFTRNENAYFRQAAFRLWKRRSVSAHPRTYSIYSTLKNALLGRRRQDHNNA